MMCELDAYRLLNLYTHIPIFVVSIFLAVFVLSADKKNSINRNLFIFILFFCFWVIDDLLQWWSLRQEINLFFTRLSIFETVSVAFFLFFVYAFIKKELGWKQKALLLIPYIPLVFLFLTKYNVYIVGGERCNTELGGLYWYGYLISIVYTLWSLVLLFSYYRNKDVEKKIKDQIKKITVGIVIGVLWFIFFSILTSFSVSNNYWVGDGVSLFIPFGMVIFISFLVYAITKHQFLNLKLLAAQALTYSIWILIGSQYFFASSTIVYLLVTLTLLLSVVFGIMLIKSIRLEVQRKEELQDMSNKLAQANDQLRKLDNAKSEFISIASHQLRTPLTAIKGFVSLLLEGSYGKISPKQEDVLNKVYLSNDRLVNLVEDLLNISRIESGRMEFKFELWQVEDICQEVMDTFVIRAKEHGLSLDYKKPSELLPKIMVDGAKVREVISNMVDNAIKYTPKGGVTLKIEKVFGEAQSIPSAEGSVRVTVSDTGIGIPETELPYLFAKFSRGKDVKRLNAGGTGLGLYVGRNMIEASGGKIWAESGGQDKGSRFIIELPVGENKAEVEKRLEKFVEKL